MVARGGLGERRARGRAGVRAYLYDSYAEALFAGNVAGVIPDARGQQGVELGRPSRLEVRLLTAGQVVERVIVSGRALRTLIGALILGRSHAGGS